MSDEPMSVTPGSPGLEMTQDPPPPLEKKAEFVPASLRDFVEGKGLWAANFFVLWPLGLALTISVDRDQDPPVYSDLHVREWVFPEGERGETINLTSEENTVEYQKFLEFCFSRITAMKPSERRMAVGRLGQFDIATADKIIAAGQD